MSVYRDLSKRKDFLKYPELLDIHIKRMQEANDVVGSYMKDSELLKSGLQRFEKFAGADACKNVLAAIDKIPPAHKRTNESRVSDNCREVQAKAREVVLGYFQDKAVADAERIFNQHSYMQHIMNLPDDKDIQKVLHSDTFFHCLKFWYFPHPVSKEDGSFWYVPESVVVTDKLLDWHRCRVEDMRAGKVEEWRTVGHVEGSFRINEEELAVMGLKPIPVEVDADTLVVANVFGFHRRGDVEKPTRRLSLHGSVRLEPFQY